METIAHAVTLQFVCVPRQGASVFIEATIKNTSKYDLLTGPVSVFMDGGFVTKTQLRVSATTRPHGLQNLIA